MNAMTEYFKNLILKEKLIDKVVYCGLVTDKGIEVVGGGYERQEVSFRVPANGQTVNSKEVVFPIASAVWGKIVKIGLYNQKSGGNILWIDVAEVPLDIGVANQYRIPENFMIVRFS